MIHVSPTAVSLVVTVFLLLLLTGAAWLSREKPGSKMFVVLQGLSVVWVVLTVVGLSLPAGTMRLRIWGFTTGMSLVVIVFWLGFIVRYTGGAAWLTRRRFGTLSLPLIFGATLYAVVPDWQPLVGSIGQRTIRAGTVVEASVGPIGSILGLYIYGVFILGLAIVARTILRGNSLFVGQALALVLGTLVTVLASGLSIAGIPTQGYPTTQVALAGQTMLWGYALLGEEFLRRVPAVATIGERAVFEDLEEGVVVVDADGTITRANARARSYLDRNDLGGGQVAPLLDRVGVSALSELPARFESHQRTYRVKASPITDWRGAQIGTALVIQDVTPIFRRQQRLQVLNRILRHNVRNDMTLVLGMSNRLRDRDDSQLTEIGVTLQEKANDLASISEKAVEIERILDDPLSVASTDLEDTVEEVLSPLASQYPAATVEQHVLAEKAHTDSRILSIVLDEVVENALEHAGDAPHVSVDVERVGDDVRIAVADDGPGIPRGEVDPIMAGEETDLRHASGLGLWLIHWGARSLGGDVRFDTADDGSTVTLSIPDIEETDAPVAPEGSRFPTSENGATSDEGRGRETTAPYTNSGAVSD